MQGRTFLRTMFDNLLFNNPICKAILRVVNFCNEQDCLKQKKLKISKNMPFNKKEEYSGYSRNFIFDGKKASGVIYK